jgi:hypothetical protein
LRISIAELTSHPSVRNDSESQSKIAACGTGGIGRRARFRF